MSVNYLIEINGLDDWELTHPIPATAYKLLRKLQYLANKERFPERISVSNGLLMSMIGCSEDSLIKARNWLNQAGLIVYKGQKKLTPLYMIHYFSNNPVYNSKLQSYEQGIKQGNEQGFEQGIERGYEQGTYINQNKGNKIEKEEDGITTFQQGLPSVRSHLLYRGTGRGAWETEIGARMSEIERALPKRNRELTPEEAQTMDGILAFLDNMPMCGKTLFQERRTIVDRILFSDRFPLGLVGEALSMAVRRNDRYELRDPIKYVMHLLFDWEERGIKTLDDLRDDQSEWRDEAVTL